MRVRIVYLALIAGLLSASTARAGEICAGPQDHVALTARLVQTELMVAALSCGTSHRYNNFVRKFQPILALQNRRMGQFFQRTYGGDGTRQTNDFVTRTANEISERSLGERTAFCASAAELFDQADQLPSQEFETFVRNYAMRTQPAIAVCQGGQNAGMTSTAAKSTRPKKNPPA